MRAEFEAFAALAAEHQQLAGKISEVAREDADGNLVRANYLILTPHIPRTLADDRFTALQSVDSDRFLSIDARVVATTVTALLELAEALQAQVIGQTLDVASRRCEPVVMATDNVEEGRARLDRTARLQYLDMTFEFWSRRG